MKPGDRVWVVFGTEPREVIATKGTGKLATVTYVWLLDQTTDFPVDREFVHETKAEAYGQAYLYLKQQQTNIENDIRHKEEILGRISQTLAKYELEIENASKEKQSHGESTDASAV